MNQELNMQQLNERVRLQQQLIRHLYYELQNTRAELAKVCIGIFLE